jgi:glycosyltransferase involved in cell wall biosynthesis
VLGVRRSYRYHDRVVARALRREAAHFDLVHCWPQASVETFKVARAVGVKAVREVPNTHTGHAFEVVARELAALGLEPARGYSHTSDPGVLEREEEEYRLADLLLVPSESSRDTFLRRGFGPDKLALHQYGFDPDRFHTNGAGARVPREGLIALFVGRCEPRKGLHHALKAWIDSGAAERGRFVICGDFVAGYREVLAPLLEHPSVEVRGFVSDPGAIMGESDILLLPSIEEGSAVVTYEAQASGCVLVVSDATGARCEHLRQGLVHLAGDVETLTEHVRRLNEDRELLERLRRATLADRDELSWDRAGEQLAAVYAMVSERVTSDRGEERRSPRTYSNG